MNTMRGVQVHNRTERGWAKPDGALKPHYFLNLSVSLCGQWHYDGQLTPKAGTPRKCTTCTRKLWSMEEE